LNHARAFSWFTRCKASEKPESAHGFEKGIGAGGGNALQSPHSPYRLRNLILAVIRFDAHGDAGN
jgi:hypothetical protein